MLSKRDFDLQVIEDTEREKRSTKGMKGNREEKRQGRSSRERDRERER